MQTHLKPSGLRSIKSVWTNPVKPTWGARTVGSIRRSEIQEWISTFPLGATSARRTHNALSQIFDLAVDDGCVAANPAKGVRLPRKPRPVKVYLTMEQVRTLADESSQPAIVWFLATTGIRCSELAGLQVGDVNLSGQRKYLQRAAVTVGSRVEIGSLKSHESRSVAIRGSCVICWSRSCRGAVRISSCGLVWMADAMEVAHLKLGEPKVSQKRGAA